MAFTPLVRIALIFIALSSHNMAIIYCKRGARQTESWTRAVFLFPAEAHCLGTVGNIPWMHGSTAITNQVDALICHGCY